LFHSDHFLKRIYPIGSHRTRVSISRSIRQYERGWHYGSGKSGFPNHRNANDASCGASAPLATAVKYPTNGEGEGKGLSPHLLKWDISL
jgi:hypothetical protein